jgi:hypothetical protein
MEQLTAPREPALAHKLVVAIAVLVMAIGMFVRCWGLFTDMWLDEIWSLNMGLTASSAINVATVYKFQHDNNHILNTVWLHFLGGDRPFYAYRLLSFFCGVLALPLTWALCRRHGEKAAFLGTFLIATWYQFAHYTSEARGYAPMLFFILLAWWSLERYLDRMKWYDALAFIVSCVLGVLSHFTFIFALAGFIYLAWARGGWKQVIAVNAIPVGFAYALYDEFVRKMKIGGGPVLGIDGAIDQYSAQTIGVVALPIIAVCIIGIVWQLRRDGMVLLVVVAAMAAVLLVREPKYLYGRYFIAFTPFLLILMARWMATWTSRGAVAAILVLWMCGQAPMTRDFLRFGRGHYAAAMRYMQSTQPGTIGPAYEKGIFDSTLIRFYGGKMSLDHPEWLVLSRAEGFEPEFDMYGEHFVFDRAYDYRGIAGTPWFIYRRATESVAGDSTAVQPNQR